MQKSKLVRILFRLDRQEIGRFAKALQSRAWSAGADVINLFKYLKKYYPQTDHRKLDKEKVFYKIYGEKWSDDEKEAKNQDRKIRKLMTTLNSALEDFLVQTELELEPQKRKQLLLNAHQRRNNSHEVGLILKRLIEELEVKKYKSGGDFLELYQLKSQWFSNLNSFKFRAEEKSVEAVMHNLDLFYFDAKLKLINEMLNRQKALSTDYKIRLKKEVENAVADLSKTYLSPSMAINLKMIQLLENETQLDSFRELSVYLDEHIEAIPKEEKLEIVQRLINYTILAYHQGHLLFLQEQFELYKMALENDLILQNRTISDTAFTNIVVVGTSLGAFDWVRNFIDKYLALLPEKVRFDAYELAMAYFNFYQKDYDDVIKRLQNVKKFLPSYGIRIRSLLLRTYFEVFLTDPTYLDFLYDYFIAFHKYVKEHKNLSKDRKQAYVNLIDMTKLFADKITAGTARAEKAPLREELERKTAIIAKIWLLKKLDEF